MKLLIPVWNNRVAPVFDSAVELVRIESNGDSWRIVDRIPLEGSPQQKVASIGLMEADVLICGAIPWRFERVLNELGLQVIPFIAGELDIVVSAMVAGELENNPIFSMPGCANRENRGKSCRFDDSPTQRFTDATKFAQTKNRQND